MSVAQQFFGSRSLPQQNSKKMWKKKEKKNRIAKKSITSHPIITQSCDSYIIILFFNLFFPVGILTKDKNAQSESWSEGQNRSYLHLSVSVVEKRDEL